MCSAPNPSDDAQGADARARIVEVAIDLVGREGATAATVRRVAAAADVSPALVMHHFGSKAGLLSACEMHVMATIERAVEALGTDQWEVSFTELVAAKGAGPAVSYIGRVLQDGGESGRQWFDWMIQLTQTGIRELAEAGIVRPSADPQMQALLLLAMDIGLVMLRQHVERYLGASITDPDVVERWATTELDLLTHGVFLEPPHLPPADRVATPPSGPDVETK